MFRKLFFFSVGLTLPEVHAFFVSGKTVLFFIYSSVNYNVLRNFFYHVHKSKLIQKLCYNGIYFNYPRNIFSAPAHFCYPFCFDSGGYVHLD